MMPTASARLALDGTAVTRRCPRALHNHPLTRNSTAGAIASSVNKLKQFCCLATRYDKLARTFLPHSTSSRLSSF